MAVHADSGALPGARPGAPTAPQRPHIRQLLFAGGSTEVRRYMAVVGVSGWGPLLLHELLTGLLGFIPGALGLLLRRTAYPLLFREVGRGVVFGRGLVLRHAKRISLGDRVVLDDGVVLDGRAGDGIVLGEEVVVNRGAALHAKDGSIRIGAYSDIGAGSTLNSPGRLEVGRRVSLGGNCHLGGRSVELEAPDAGRAGDPSESARPDVRPRERTGDRPDDRAGPGLRRYTQGGVRVGDRCFLGGRVHVLDGVSLGEDCIVGAGIVVREDVPAGHAVLPRERPVVVPRGMFRQEREEGAAPAEAPAARERSQRIVRRALERMNAQLPPGRRLRLDEDAPLLEPEGPLDSLGVVNLVVTLEEVAQEELGRYVELLDSARVAEGRVPFSTAGSLARHLRTLLAEPVREAG